MLRHLRRGRRSADLVDGRRLTFRVPRDSLTAVLGGATRPRDASRADIEMTQAIVAVARPLGIAVYDRAVAGKDGHAGVNGMRLI
jgi:DNA repair protein RadC